MEALERSIDHFLLCRSRPVETVAGAAGHLVHERSLRATVAFTKRMQRVNFTKVMRGTIEELFSPHALQVVVGGEISEHFLSVRIDVLDGRERGRAFADFHGTGLTRPIVDILEQRLVNVLQVLEVELATHRVGNHRRLAQRACVSLEVGEFRRVGKTEFVSERTAYRIEVGVDRHETDRPV